ASSTAGSGLAPSLIEATTGSGPGVSMPIRGRTPRVSCTVPDVVAGRPAPLHVTVWPVFQVPAAVQVRVSPTVLVFAGSHWKPGGRLVCRWVAVEGALPLLRANR